MSKTIKLKKGFDINLAGKAQNKVEDLGIPSSVAVKPVDFVGYEKPKLLVKEGDTVKAGSPIYYDKSLENVMYTSPVSGKVTGVLRGDKRRLLEITIDADAKIKYETFKKHTASELVGLSREDAIEGLTKSGLWPQIVQRPYAVVANPADTPKAIFISAFDTNPLAPDYEVIFEGEEDNFKAGIEVIKKLTQGIVHLNVDGAAEVSKLFSGAKGIQLNKVSGPHPAGNVGVQIHHIDPIAKGDIVWTVGPAGVIQIGKLFLEGKYDASKVISVAGSEVKKPQYYKTISGASIEGFIKGNLKSKNVRCISGSPLTGNKIEQDGYLGYYDSSVAVVPEGDDLRFFGSFAPSSDRLSFHRSIGLFSFMNKFTKKDKEYVIDTNIQGEHRPFVISGSFERVLPMDVYPTYLLKAILAEDFEEMEALGIYEVAEEDLALCEFIDVSKNEIQSIVRQGLDLMKNS